MPKSKKLHGILLSIFILTGLFYMVSYNGDYPNSAVSKIGKFPKTANPEAYPSFKPNTSSEDGILTDNFVSSLVFKNEATTAENSAENYIQDNQVKDVTHSAEAPETVITLEDLNNADATQIMQLLLNIRTIPHSEEVGIDGVEMTSTLPSSPPKELTTEDFNKILQDTASKLLDFMTTTRTPISNETLQILKSYALDKERGNIFNSLVNFTRGPNDSISTSGEFSNEFNLSSYTIDGGGKPIRNIILTTWRSGSTFLGEAVQSHPGMFYHYEPLLHFEIVQVRSGELAEDGLRVINQLLQCNYTQLDDYVEYGRNHSFLHSHNGRMYKYCREAPELCTDSDFLQKMCAIFPFQIMKTVRLRLRLAESLLEDENLDVRILLLVRDPRGTMQSRKHRDWCPNNPDCADSALLCADMVDDFKAAGDLRQKYSEKLMIIRYEDLSLNPLLGIRKVLNFFRLPFHPSVERFLETHTSENLGGVSSTFRDSKSTPFKWTQYFQNASDSITQELDLIQGNCAQALELWGYDLFKKEEDFNPLLDPPWNDMMVL